jgi:multicomponent Na+:H+ antiporter subunit D
MGHVDRLTITALSLLMVGFLIKAAVVPFHFWLIDTASSAPLPLAMILAGVLDTLGVYAVARLYWTVFATPLAGHHQVVQGVLVSIGAISAVVGAAMAVLFREARRRLGFVMVSHTGILLVGVGCLTVPGLAGAGVYAVGDGTVKAALFAGVALLGLSRPDDHQQTAVVLSRARRRGGLALVAVGGLATAGLPLFGTGLGKAVIEDAATVAGYRWAVPIIILAATLSAAAVLDIAWTATRLPTSTSQSTDSLQGSWAPTFGIGAALLGAAAAAATIGRWATSAAFHFVDTAGYQQRVFGGAPVLAGKLPAAIRLSASGALIDLATVAAAVAMAAVLNLNVMVRGRVLRPSKVRATLGRLHNGSIGDSATWVTLGTATVAMILALGLR